MKITELLQKQRLYSDGGMGTLLQARGLQAGELPEYWNLTHAEDIIAIHEAYLRAGSHIISTNTFGAYRTKMENIEAVISAAVANVKEAIRRTDDGTPRFVAYDMGPIGKLLQPLGELAFEDAVSIFSESIRIAVKCGVDLILIETMNDAYETKAAVLAAKEACDLPIFVTCAYDASGKLMTGATPEAMVALLEGLRVDALGINCSLGPRQMLPTVERLLACASIPVMVCPNAGLPRSENGKTVFDVNAEEFSVLMAQIAQMGAAILGGCCGTTPEYIENTVKATQSLPYSAPTEKQMTCVSSYTHAVQIGASPILIGERINPTGKAKFKDALRRNDLNYIIGEGLSQEEAGAHILDVNVGLPEICEKEVMVRVVQELQAVCALPLQLDTVDPACMEAAMRIYNGKPLINSVNGKQESMDAILPLAAKYGGTLIALTLDEEGIPNTAEGRFAIAKRIVAQAEKYGIRKKDIVVDPLAMAISADANSANVTLDTIRLLKEKLGVAVSLGVSNISFGLPARDLVTSTFFSMALYAGLDCAIMNPHSAEMQKVYHSFCALRGLDDNCAAYIAFATNLPTQVQAAAPATPAKKAEDKGTTSPLCHAIVKGLRDPAFAIANEILAHTDPMRVIHEEIIPALDIVGRGFEKNTVFLPQLLMSAEAAKAAFEAVRQHMPQKTASDRANTIILATVKGDIHDIGKNIVKVLLENYGFEVIDLGRDVSPEAVCDAASAHKAKLVCLSALMTTTVPAMEETIVMLRQRVPDAKVVVGGAVMTQEYADRIGADHYAKDAMQAVRFAEQVFGA